MTLAQAPTPHSSPLPQRLKEATRSLHQQVERSGVMADVLSRSVSRKAYVALLANLQGIYKALESALASAPGDLARLGHLARSAALTSDLRAFGLPVPALEPAAQDYAQRLTSLQGTQAHRLWAHVYVRYLGDLHGGQILSRLVAAHFAQPGAQGTRFYEFGGASAVQALRDVLRQQLAEQRLHQGQADEVVAEACWAFEAHGALFEQIRSRWAEGATAS